MDKILVVDNEAPGPRTFADILSRAIDDVTGGRIGVEKLLNVILEDALPEVKQKMQQVSCAGDKIRWLLIDLADEYAKVHDAGARLLDKIKGDPSTQNTPVVIYTSKYVQFNTSDLVRRGALNVIVRAASGHKELDDLAEEVLDAFMISY